MTNCVLSENVLADGFKGAYIVDIIAVVLLFFWCLQGARKGAVRMLVGFISTALAVIVAFVFADEFAVSLNEWFSVGDGIGKGIASALAKVKGFDTDVSQTGMSAALEGVNLPSFIKSTLIENFSDSTIPEGTTLAMKAGEVLGGYALRVLSWIALFLLVKLTLSILTGILTGIAERVVILSALNSVLGGVIGILKALIVICGALAIASILPIDALGTFLNDTFLLRYLYNENPLMLLFNA